MATRSSPRFVPERDARRLLQLLGRGADASALRAAVQARVRRDDARDRTIYAFTKGIVLVNDGMAYGERTRERRLRVSRDGRAQTLELEALRTRTGKRVLRSEPAG